MGEPPGGFGDNSDRRVHQPDPISLRIGYETAVVHPTCMAQSETRAPISRADLRHSVV